MPPKPTPPLRTGSACVGLRHQHGTQVRVEDFHPDQRVERDQVALLRPGVGDHDPHRQAVVGDHSRASTGAFTRASQRTAHESDGVAVESQVVIGRRTDVDGRIVSDGGFQGTIQGQRGGRGSHNGVDRGGSAEAHHRPNLRFGSGEAIEGDGLVPVSRVARSVVDSTRRVPRDHGVVGDRPTQTVSQRDACGVASRLGVSRHLVRKPINGDEVPVRPRTSDPVHGQDGVTLLVPGGVVDRTSGRGVSPSDARSVLAHEEVEAELLPDRRIPQSRAVVPDLVGTREPFRFQSVGFGLGGENEVPHIHVCFVFVHHLSSVEDVILDVRRVVADLPGRVHQEAVVLTEQHTVKEPGVGLHGRGHVGLHQVLERQAFLTVLDEERDVNVLVQFDRHVRGACILDGHVIRVPLPHCFELTRPTGVDRVAEVGDVLGEVTVNEVPHHHVFFEDRQRFLCPDFRDQGVDAVVEVLLPHRETATLAH